jgi:phospholipase C
MKYFITKASKIFVTYRSHITFGIIVFLFSSFLLTFLGLTSMILPLAYAQQIGSANHVTSPIKHIVVIMQENRSFDKELILWLMGCLIF